MLCGRSFRIIPCIYGVQLVVLVHSTAIATDRGG